MQIPVGSSVIGGIPRPRPGARSGGPAREVFDETLDAANDNDAGKQIARTRQVWQPRLGRDLTDEDARQIMQNVTGFFGVLAEWSRAERLAANDAAAPAKPNDGEVRHER